jgi:hypothetical protein
MTTLRIAAMSPLTLVALLACVWGLHEWVSPPFTDAEIRDSFVDTWEPSAWMTLLELVVLGCVFLISLLVLVFTRQRSMRVLTIATATLAIGGALLSYRNHVALTERTTALTGQTFGKFHGLL